MPRYHVNNNGEPGACRARTRPCPFGGAADHFDTKEAAREHYERLNQDGGFANREIEYTPDELRVKLKTDYMFRGTFRTIDGQNYIGDEHIKDKNLLSRTQMKGALRNPNNRISDSVRQDFFLYQQDEFKWDVIASGKIDPNVVYLNIKLDGRDWYELTKFPEKYLPVIFKKINEENDEQVRNKLYSGLYQNENLTPEMLGDMYEAGYRNKEMVLNPKLPDFAKEDLRKNSPYDAALLKAKDIADSKNLTLEDLQKEIIENNNTVYPSGRFRGYSQSKITLDKDKITEFGLTLDDVNNLYTYYNRYNFIRHQYDADEGTISITYDTTD